MWAMRVCVLATRMRTWAATHAAHMWNRGPVIKVNGGQDTQRQRLQAQTFPKVTCRNEPSFSPHPNRDPSPCTCGGSTCRARSANRSASAASSLASSACANDVGETLYQREGGLS